MDHRIQQVHQGALLPKRTEKLKEKNSHTPFQEVFQKAQGEVLKVSKHAQVRLTERNIEISEEKWQEIASQVNEARQKGISDSLVITDEATLLVSTKNNMVVTAMNRQEAKSRIFTNIDGTIVLD